MATAKSSSPAPSREDAAADETLAEQRTLIRDVFAAEFGGAYIDAVNVKTPELFNALTARELGDLDAEDDGSPHSEVLKNTIGLLQRFHLCALTFPELGGGRGRVPDKMRTNVHALFWKTTFCEKFCGGGGGMEGLDAGKVWCDVRRFVVALKMIWDNDPDGGRPVPARARLAAAALYPPQPPRKRGRKNALLWQLMGVASVGLREDVRHRDMTTWAAETTARIGLWRRLFNADRDSILRGPINEDTRAYPKDVLPEYSEGESFKHAASYYLSRS